MLSSRKKKVLKKKTSSHPFNEWWNRKSKQNNMANTSAGGFPNLNNIMRGGGVGTAGTSSPNNTLNNALYGNYGAAMPQYGSVTIVFYGFTGILAKKYSVIEYSQMNAIQSKIELSPNKIPWKFENMMAFEQVLNMFDGSENALEQIDIDDAMNLLRIGPEKVEVDDFEEPEVDEFDDNCVESCKPGLHACGK